MDYLNELTGISYEEEEEYVAYDDDVEEEEDFFDYDFEYIDESKSDLFGISVIDIAKQFGMAIIPSRGICAVYIGDKSQKQIQSLANCFEAHECDPDDDGAMEVQFVRKDNYVLRPGVFVSGLTFDAVMEHLQTAV